MKSVRTSAQGELRIVGHCVGFIQNDELHPRAEQALRPGELLDLPPNYIDASIVRCVELFGWKRVHAWFIKSRLQVWSPPSLIHTHTTDTERI